MTDAVPTDVPSALSVVVLSWRDVIDNDEVNALHAEAFDHPVFDDDWTAQLDRYSLGWTTARQSGRLVGFVNVLTDGGVHAWIQDVIVANDAQRSGVGTRLVAAVREHVTAAGCEWLHVDFDDEHTDFYIEACGFRPTRAGLIEL